MTTSTTESIISYSGNDSSDTFSIPFSFNGDSEIVVYLITNSTNAVAAWTNPTHYSISGTDVVAVTPPASGTTLVIQLSVTKSQSTDYVENDAFPAETHEAALDKLTRMVKELKAIVDYRCVKLPVNRLTSTTVTDTDIVADRYFKVNSSANGVELAEGTTVAVSDSALSGLTDVTISGAVTGDLMTYSGTNWINSTLAAYNTSLYALSTLTAVADKLPYFNSTGTATTADLTSFARTLLDDASASTARSTLGIGTMGTQAASNVAITGGSVTGITDLAVADGGTGSSTAAGARTALGLEIGSNIQAWYAALDSIGGLTTVANKMIYATASNTYATTDLTATARTLLDDSSTSAMRTTLGVAIGTDVQAYDVNLDTLSGLSSVANLSTLANLASVANLSAIAGVTSAADKVSYFTGSGTADVTDLSSFARTLIDDTSASAARTTLGITDAWVYLGSLNAGNSWATTTLLDGYDLYKIIMRGYLLGSTSTNAEMNLQFYIGGAYITSGGWVASSSDATPSTFEAVDTASAGTITLARTTGGAARVELYGFEITVNVNELSTGNMDIIAFGHAIGSGLNEDSSSIVNILTGCFKTVAGPGATLTGVKFNLSAGSLTDPYAVTGPTKIHLYGLKTS